MLELKDVTLLVGADSDQKALIHEATLHFPPAHFTAVVGPSGCGKSTLLKIIAGLLEPTTGSVHWEGRDLSQEEDLAPSEIGYVPQFSIAYEHLDVWESVETSMRLRVGGLSENEIALRTEHILREVGLDGILDRRVSVLSGGQKRRLSLALEMVTAPALLLADEVTSGLDPKAEKEMVELMHAVSRKEKCIVLNVTHSLSHLDLYDSILVLHEGHVAYHGPTRFLLHYFDVHSPEEIFPRLTQKRAIRWHESWEKHHAAYAETASPALEKAAEETRVEREALKESSDRENADLAKPKLEDEPEGEKDGDKKEEPAPLDSGPSLPPGMVSQFATLLGRRFRIFRRDKGQLWIHLALILGFPLLVVIFALDGLPAIQNLSMTMDINMFDLARERAQFSEQSVRVGSLVSGLVMFQVVLLTLMGANNAAREIAGERLIFEKEKLGGVRASSYVLSKAVFLLFLVTIQSVWMAVFVKVICRFPGDLLQQILLLLLVNAAMTAVCLGISAIMKSAEQASLLSIYLVGFQLPLSGAVLALPDFLGEITRPFIASYWSWSGVLQTMRDTRFYDLVTDVSQTPLASLEFCVWVLCCHIGIGLFIAWLGTNHSRWE